MRQLNSVCGAWHVCPLIFLLVAVVPCQRSLAAEFLQGEEVIIEADQVIPGDLFVMASHAVIAGTVEGDLFVLAESIELTGKVTGSANLGGKTIQIGSEIEGSMRAAGQSITLLPESIVQRDVMVAGESIVSEVGSRVGGQLYLGAAKAHLHGEVAGVATLAVDQAEITGSFGADVWIQSSSGAVQAGDVSGLVIGDGAAVAGNLNISATREPEISDKAVISGETLITAVDVAVEQPADPVRSYVRTWLLAWGQFLVVGIGFRLVLPGRTKRYLQNLHRLPILAAILGPVYWLLIAAGGALALAATLTATAGLYVVELWDAMPLILFIGFVVVVTVWGGGGLLGFVLGPVLTGVWFCRTLLSWLPGFGQDAFVLPVLLGTGLIAAGAAIPSYGWILWLVTASLGSGAFLTRSQAEPPPAVGATKTRIN